MESGVQRLPQSALTVQLHKYLDPEQCIGGSLPAAQPSSAKAAPAKRICPALQGPEQGGWKEIGVKLAELSGAEVMSCLLIRKAWGPSRK